MTEVKETAEILEETSQVIEDTLNLMEAKWFHSRKFLIGSALLAGLAIGAGATYLVASKRLETKYRALADSEIEDVKNHYSLVYKTDGPTLEELASRYEDEAKVANAAVAESIIQREGYNAYDQVPSSVEAPASPVNPQAAATIVEQSRVVIDTVREEIVQPEEQNVFDPDTVDANFIYTEEMARRAANPNEPFVISREEFDEGEPEYDQTQLTYYDGDDVLCDSLDKPIDDLDAVVGFPNIMRFGHGSGDPNVVYVRNSRLGLDMEVTHSDGTYTKEVLGFNGGGDELQHSDKRKPRRMRPSDD